MFNQFCFITADWNWSQLIPVTMAESIDVGRKCRLYTFTLKNLPFFFWFMLLDNGQKRGFAEHYDVRVTLTCDLLDIKCHQSISIVFSYNNNPMNSCVTAKICQMRSQWHWAPKSNQIILKTKGMFVPDLKKFPQVVQENGTDGRIDNLKNTTPLATTVTRWGIEMRR